MLFVFVSDDFDMNTIAYIYLFCEKSFIHAFFATSGKNRVLSQPMLYSPNLFCKECIEDINEN